MQLKVPLTSTFLVHLVPSNEKRKFKWVVLRSHIPLHPCFRNRMEELDTKFKRSQWKI